MSYVLYTFKNVISQSVMFNNYLQLLFHVSIFWVNLINLLFILPLETLVSINHCIHSNNGKEVRSD